MLQQGEVRLAGRVVGSGNGFHLPPEERDVGLVFQEYALFPHMTVSENVAFGLDNLSRAKKEEVVANVVDMVGIDRMAERYPHALSGGQQQRVALARALAPKPKLLLLDEPFSGLDSRLRDQIRDDTLHVLKQSDAATLLVTHDPEEAMFMGDRIVVLRDGTLQQEGPPDDLYFSPVNRFVAEFFSDVNHITGRVKNGAVETVVGIFETKEIADGTEVDILIRPEAVRLVPTDEGSSKYQAEVLASRLLGRSSLVHLCTCRQTDEEIHLHSRMPGRFLPKEKEVLALELDPNQTFIFPAV